MDAIIEIKDLTRQTYDAMARMTTSHSDIMRALTKHDLEITDIKGDVKELKRGMEAVGRHMQKEDELPGQLRDVDERNKAAHDRLFAGLQELREIVDPELQAARARVLSDLRIKIAKAGPLMAIVWGLIKFIVSAGLAIWILGKTGHLVWPK